MKYYYFFTQKITFSLCLILIALTGLAQQTIPGTIEAESFVTKHGNIQYTPPNSYVSGFATSRWATYSINVAQAGDYTLTLNETSNKAGTYSLTFQTDAGASYDKTFSFDGNTGSNTNYQDVVLGNLTLPAGTQTITLTSGGQAFRLDWFKLETAGDVPATSVSISTCSTENIIAGLPHQLTANVVPANATNTNVTWSSSNDAIATVDVNGLVTTVAEGMATITVTTEDGNFTDTCTINVDSVPVGVNLISNGNFSISDESDPDFGWSFAVNASAGAAATFSIVNEEGVTVITTTGTLGPQVRLEQETYFIAGYNYTVTFDVKSTNPTSSEDAEDGIRYFSIIDEVRAIGPYEDLTTGFTTYTYNWDQTISGIAPIQLQFGKSSGTVTIDNISLLNNGESSPLSVGTLKDVDKIKMYPNPTKDKLTIEDSEGATITIYNMLGSLVYSTNLKSNQETIDLSGLSNALYMVKIFHNGVTTTAQKLVKN